MTESVKYLNNLIKLLPMSVYFINNLTMYV
jgi:hypothetical protein